MAVSNLSNLFSVLETEARHCERHGEYTAKKFAIGGGQWTPCPECGREKIASEDAALARGLRVERLTARERRQAEILGREDADPIPPRFRRASFDGYQVAPGNDGQAKALARARWYAETWQERRAAGTCMIFCGTEGTGKTHLACAIANALRADGVAAMYARAYELPDAVRQTYGRGEVTERDVLAVFITADLLVIDEVGRQRGTDDEKLLLFKVIEARYASNRPTILITNADLAGLSNYLDDSTRGRLREGGGKAVVFDWESARNRL